jgi:alpha-glucosidase (family GH31 glycosyl hydrolase)
VSVTIGAASSQAIASLSPDDGSLAVFSGGAHSLVRTPAGRSLIAVRLDRDDPDRFHDPDVSVDGDFVDLRDLAVGAAASSTYPWAKAQLSGSIPGYPGSAITIYVGAGAADAPEALAIACDVSGAPVVQIELRLASDDGAYVGLGEHFDHVDAKGTLVPLAFRLGSFDSGTNETHVPVPFFASSRGYGVAVDTSEVGAADVAKSDPSLVRLVFEGSSFGVRLWAQPDPLQIVAASTRRSGLPRLPPRWAYAPMQWRNEGVDTAKVLDDLTTTRAQKIPGGCIWIDNPWQASYDDSTFDPAAFADPKAMIAQARALGFEVLNWSTPYLEFAASTPANQAQRLFVEAKAKGYFVTDAKGNVFDTPASVAGKTRVGMLDLPSAPASAWWTAQLETVTSLGTAGFKLDFAEDLVPDFLGERLALTVGGKPLRQARLAYAPAYHQAYRAAFEGLRDDAFILGRAASPGGQQHVDALWPGDLDSDFGKHASPTVGGLPASVCGMVNLAASGFPHYAADTGGFRGGRPTKEHFLRWAEVNAHSMIFQSGGGGASHNPWTFDAETVVLFRALARRHMDLYPYLRSLSLAAAQDGTPTVRALPLAYPLEVAAIGAHADDEYLLGPDVLIAPVMQDAATSREVYVPGGAWTRWSTGERFLGGRAVAMTAPLGEPIVLVREAAVLPLLAGDVDTLGDASDPSVVTAKMRATTYRAYAVPYAKTRATWEDGTLLDVSGGTDKNQSVVVTFVPAGAAGTLTVTMDLANRNALPMTWNVDGATPDLAASADAVDACTGACMFLDAAKKRVTLHFAQGGSASGSK